MSPLFAAFADAAPVRLPSAVAVRRDPGEANTAGYIFVSMTL